MTSDGCYLVVADCWYNTTIFHLSKCKKCKVYPKAHLCKNTICNVCVLCDLSCFIGKRCSFPVLIVTMAILAVLFWPPTMLLHIYSMLTMPAAGKTLTAYNFKPTN